MDTVNIRSAGTTGKKVSDSLTPVSPGTILLARLWNSVSSSDRERPGQAGRLIACDDGSDFDLLTAKMNEHVSQGRLHALRSHFTGPLAHGVYDR